MGASPDPTDAMRVEGPNVGRTSRNADLASAMQRKIQSHLAFGATGKGEARTAPLEGTEAGTTVSIFETSGAGM